MSRHSLPLFLMLALTGCAENTPYGRCVGVNQQEDPTLVYEYSARNIVIGVVCIELIAPPIFVILDQLKCPVARRAPLPVPAVKHE